MNEQANGKNVKGESIISYWMNEWMNKRMNEWMNEWINEWMDRWMELLYSFTHFTVYSFIYWFVKCLNFKLKSNTTNTATERIELNNKKDLQRKKNEWPCLMNLHFFQVWYNKIVIRNSLLICSVKKPH